MKKHILTFTLIGSTTAFIIFIACQRSKPFDRPLSEKKVQLVPLDTARYVAVHFNPSFFFNTNDTSNHSPFRSSLNGNNALKDYSVINDSKGIPAIYVFNFADDKGFLFVSADYQLRPVLAFIETGNFKKDTVPEGIIQWANKTINNIETVRKGLYDNSRIAKIAWQNYYQSNEMLKTSKIEKGVNPNIVPQDNPCLSNPDYYSATTTTVGPLLPVTWGQDCSYNDLCPNENCDDCSPLAVTGCVATAIAQVIRYWQPASSFNYNYASMPATQGNGEVQRLMHDAGVKVNMSYGCAINGGSSADNTNVPGALKSYFGFSSANYSSYDIGSYSTVQSDLNSHWPVLLGGCSDRTNVFLGIWYTYQNCHEWVCDGYQQTDVSYCLNGNLMGDSYLYFHMNWGWHEFNAPNDYNGWFGFDNWTPGNGDNFQYAQDKITSIHP